MDLKLWLSISNQRNVPHSLLLYTRINDYCGDIFEVGEDEAEEKILRRVSNSITFTNFLSISIFQSPDDTYQLEKMRVFEETFGIDKLQNMVTTIG